MKSLFSLMVTIVLGYLLWQYLAPLSPFKSNTAASASAAVTAPSTGSSPMDVCTSAVGNSVKNMFSGGKSPY